MRMNRMRRYGMRRNRIRRDGMRRDGMRWDGTSRKRLDQIKVWIKSTMGKSYI